MALPHAPRATPTPYGSPLLIMASSLLLLCFTLAAHWRWLQGPHTDHYLSTSTTWLGASASNAVRRACSNTTRSPLYICTIFIRHLPRILQTLRACAHTLSLERAGDYTVQVPRFDPQHGNKRPRSLLQDSCWRGRERLGTQNARDALRGATQRAISTAGLEQAVRLGADGGCLKSSDVDALSFEHLPGLDAAG